MTLYYSKTTNGFYDIGIHGDKMPKDVVEITKEKHAELLQAQSDGKIIVADSNGNPKSIDRPAPTSDELAKGARQKRAALLAESDWTQVDDSPFDNVQKVAWASYRQALRDVTDQPKFPKEIIWPDKP